MKARLMLCTDAFWMTDATISCHWAYHAKGIATNHYWDILSTARKLLSQLSHCKDVSRILVTISLRVRLTVKEQEMKHYSDICTLINHQVWPQIHSIGVSLMMVAIISYRMRSTVRDKRQKDCMDILELILKGNSLLNW